MKINIFLSTIFLILLLPLISYGNDDLKTVYIHISKETPDNVSYTKWNNSIMDAAAEWLLPAGFTIIKTDDLSKAEIKVDIGTMIDEFGMVRNEWAAYCSKSKCVVFPNIPEKEDNIEIVVRPDLLKWYDGLKEILTHEFGHSIGIEHTKNHSIMQEIMIGKPSLTDYDHAMIRILKNELQLEILKNDKNNCSGTKGL